MEKTEKAPEKGPAHLEGRKILAVDDFEKWLNVVKGNAEYYGAKEKDIFFAYNIKEGERIYSLERPEIVVSDINFDANNLANREGLELLSLLHGRRTRMPEESYLYLGAMSSLDPEIEKAALASGADHFINKKEFPKGWDSFVEKYTHFQKSKKV